MSGRVINVIVTIAVLSSLMMGSMAFFSEVVSGEVSGDFAYVLVNDGTEVEITRYYGSDENLTIPGSIEGKPVVSIGEDIFSYSSSPVTITIPANLTTIAPGSFLPCGSLTAIYVAEGNGYFAGFDGVLCDYFISHIVRCPRGVTGAVIIPASVGSVDDGAFESCGEITSVTFEGHPSIIGVRAFADCSKLRSIEVPDSVYYLGHEAFYRCSSLVEFDMPDDLTAIEHGTFMECNSLVDIEIPDRVYYINPEAFRHCGSLRSIVINNPQAVVHWHAFSDCVNLTSVSFQGTIISGYAFSNCVKLRSLIISERLTYVGEFAFSSCSSLTTMELPDNVTYVGDNVFQLCSSLTSVRLPSGLTYIPPSTFAWCVSLYNVTIPENVTSIGGLAFSHCYSLRSIVIPSNVTTIGIFAFEKCERLKKITFTGDAPNVTAGWYEGSDPRLTVYRQADAHGFDGSEWQYVNVETMDDGTGSDSNIDFGAMILFCIVGIAGVAIAATVWLSRRGRL